MNQEVQPNGKYVRLTFAQLKEAAAGKWAYIFEDLAGPELSLAVANAPEHVPCPVHGGTDGYRLFEHFNQTGRGVCNTCGSQKSGFETLAWVKKYTVKDAVREVAQWLRKETVRPPAAAPRPMVVLKPKVDPQVAYERIRAVWGKTTGLPGSAAEKYLINRGIWRVNLPSTLRAHPGLVYVHGKEMTNYGRFPCLIAPIRNGKNEIVSLHRIFITEEGDKAPVPDPKKMMSPCKELRGSAIKLYEASGPVLGVSEGIETALAVHAITRMPVWSCVTAVLLEQVEIPKFVKHVVIWADLDRSERGAQAANALAERLEKEGKTVEICSPYVTLTEEQKGVDWLDVMLAFGPNGFPAKYRRWRPGMTKPS